MANLRKARESLLLAFSDNLIDDVEFSLLYDVNNSQNDYPYWVYNKFNLEHLDDAECWSEFRFLNNDIYRLKDALEIPDLLRTYNRLAVDGIKALCIFLRRFAYLCRYSNFIVRFGRAVPGYSIISSKVMDRIYNRFSYLLEDFNLPFLTPTKLEEYCRAIKRKGAALDNCFGFIDGTIRPICRPTVNQRMLYNGVGKMYLIFALLTNAKICLYGNITSQYFDCKPPSLENYFR